MLLRSGKTITLPTIPTNNSKKPKCSYCNKMGHKINKCNNNERIKKINDEIVERTVFSRVIMQPYPYTSLARRYLRLYLCGHSEMSLLMLCYYTNTKKYTTEYKKSSYINLLVEYYYQQLNKDSNTLTRMLNAITDENYEKYTNEILNNSVSLNLTFELEEMVLYYVYFYRPPQRKFNIQLVTNINTNNTNTKIECPICYETIPNSQIIRTDCGHNYCKECLIKYFKSLNGSNAPPTCACCRKVMMMLEIKNKKMRDEIQKKYCNEQLPPPPTLESSRPPTEPATPPLQAPQQHNNTYAASPLFQRIMFYFVSF